VLGANPRAMCFMNDEGYRNAGQYRGIATGPGMDNAGGFSFYRHNRDMRWGLTIGIYGPAAGQPADYPNAGRSGERRYDNKAQETWLLTTGDFLLAVAQLVRAFADRERNNVRRPEQEETITRTPCPEKS